MDDDIIRKGNENYINHYQEGFKSEDVIYKDSTVCRVCCCSETHKEKKLPDRHCTPISVVVCLDGRINVCKDKPEIINKHHSTETQLSLITPTFSQTKSGLDKMSVIIMRSNDTENPPGPPP